MKTVIVNSTLKRVVEYKEVKQDLKYYCCEKKKMYNFIGGKLEYDSVYDNKLKKSIVVPRVVELKYKESCMKSNIDEIKEWANNNLNYSNADIATINSDNVVFNVPDEEVDDFIDNLESKRFEFNVTS
jgi:hypothetical protein